MNDRKTKQHRQKRRVLFVFIFLLFFAACATFQGDIPVDSEYAEVVYISPKNQDGIQDSLQISVTVPELKGLQLAGYLVEVLDSKGNDIYSYGEEYYKKSGISGLFQRKETVKLPETLFWNGQNYEGQWVDDGTYFVHVRAWDYSKNKGQSPSIKVVVDNTAPFVLLSVPYLVFSPNNDGRQDELIILKSESTQEDLWIAEIMDAQGRKVKSYQWTGYPESVHWTGQDDRGQAVPDGSYSYLIRATDKAGNAFKEVKPGIIVDRSVYPVSIQVSETAFSPNADGVQDTVTFTVRAAGVDSVVEASLSVVNAQGQSVRSFTPEQFASGTVLFNGRDNQNVRLPEGVYYGLLNVRFRNGQETSVATDAFVLDITKPYAVINAAYTVFSPDADGRKDTVIIHQSSSKETLWQGRFADFHGRVVRTLSWDGYAIDFEWDGTNDKGELLADGAYSYTLWSVDEAGNRGSYSLPRIQIDTRVTTVKVLPKQLVFSPNGDGFDDFLEFELQPSVRDGIRSWSFQIRDAQKNLVAVFDDSMTIELPESIIWNGLLADGTAKEGFYKGTLTVEYEKGNVSVDTTEYPVKLDISGPEIRASVSPLPFSPDGDSINDVLNINIAVSDSSGIQSWSAQIVDPAGNVFYTIPTNRFRSNVFAWDGKSASGEIVQSASDYTLLVHATDIVGNQSRVETTIPVDILVLKEGDRYKISISSIYFKPYTADFMDVDRETRNRNIATLDRLAEILKKYQGYQIQLEGHAVRVYWDRPSRWETEETEVLLPLSQARAEAIKAALVQRGIVESRMTVEGKGGFLPVVPHSDTVNRWKNRRVEFYLVR